MNKLTNLKDGKRVAITHGELFILPVDKVPEGKTSRHTTLILAHSETGHHHTLISPSKVEFTLTEIGDQVERYLTIESLAELVHKKTFDIHETRVLVAGNYRVFIKKEYDVRQQAMRRVFD